MRMIKYFLLAILLVPQISFAETKYDCGKAYSSSSSATSRLKQYEYCINKEASPVQAKLLLEDKSALSATKNKYLKQQAVAIKDLYELLDQDWTEGKGNALNQSLVNRIGEGKVLSRSGLGPEIDNVLPWAKKNIERYQKKGSGQDLMNVLRIAVRDWVKLFGEEEEAAFPWEGVDEKIYISKAKWDHFTLFDRNVYLRQHALKEKEDILKNLKKGVNSNSVPKYIKYFDDIKNEVETAVQVKKAIEKAENSNVLTAKQKEELKKAETPEEKAYMLNKFFDGSKVGYDSDIRMGLNANRISNPNETFSNTNRKTVAALLKTSISSELKNTEAGKQALNGGLKIEVGFCDAGYSELKNDGTIVIDEGLIEEYMRLKGYTASSIMKNKKQLADVARYVSPEVVYQSARRDQEKWAKNTYKPHTQEDEIDARSREAVYMTEKMQKDSNFYGTFTDVEKYSSYASKNIENANSYNQGRKMFSDNVRMDNADLPTINSAAANTISLLNEEINRISKLSAKERAAERPNEKDMLSFSEVSKYTPDEISASIHDIQYTALVKLRNALMSNSYAQYNNKAIEQSRSTFNSIKPEQN